MPAITEGVKATIDPRLLLGTSQSFMQAFAASFDKADAEALKAVSFFDSRFYGFTHSPFMAEGRQIHRQLVDELLTSEIAALRADFARDFY